jgi:drug/metabolite transporter (DMT)-like permease
MESKNPVSGSLLVSIAALLWGTSFVVIEWGFENSSIDPLLFVFLRFAIATILFLPIALYKLKGIREMLLSKSIILIGLFNAFAFLFQFLGQQYTTAGKASLFVNFYAIIVEGSSLLGDLLTLCSGGAWTLYILASKKYFEKEKKASGLDVFFGTLIWTAVFLLLGLPFVFINNQWSTIVSQFSWQAIVSIFYLAIVCTIGAFAIYMIGLKKTDAGESVIFMFIEVIVAFMLGWLLLETIPQTWETVGAILIILAIIVISLKINIVKRKTKGSADLKSKLETGKDSENNST